MYENKEGMHQPLQPKDGPGGPGAMTDPLVGYEPQGQSAHQSQRSLPYTDPLQGTPYDNGRYVENLSSQERMLVEEGGYESTEMRKSLGKEALSQPRGPWEP